MGILSGFVAVFAKKGAPIHRLAGNVFFVSMLTMAGVALVMAGIKEQKLNMLAAAFTLYLVATAWAVVKRAPGTAGRFEVFAAFWAAAVSAAGFVTGRLVQTLGLQDGDPSSGNSPNIYFAVGVLGLIAVLSDLHYLKKGGLTGADRTSRHLWRMCLALFVAAGSFFFGQADKIPEALRGQHLSIPPLTALAMLVFWMVWVRVPKRRRAAPQPA
jgi:uncharacterized membrane protein